MDIAVTEARGRFNELVERAEHGEPVVLTRQGEPVVTLTAAGPRRRPTREELDALFEEIARERAKLPPISTEESIDAIKADRRG